MPAKAQRTRQRRSTQEALAISLGAQGAKLESGQRSFEGKDQGLAFFLPTEGSWREWGGGGREKNMVEVVYEGLTPAPALPVTTET